MKKVTKKSYLGLFMGIVCSINALYAQVPSWSVNSADYSLDASVIAVLKINGKISTDTNDIVAIFDAQDKVRGVTKITYNNALDKHLAFLSVHSNTSGDKLKFKIYDASADKVYETKNATLEFVPNQILGSNDTPHEIVADTPLSVTHEGEITGFSLAPNPTKGMLLIKANENITAIRIFSVLGKEVKSVVAQERAVNLNISTLRPGIYLIKVFANHKTRTQKVVKF